jgi:hypothetical protein
MARDEPRFESGASANRFGEEPGIEIPATHGQSARTRTGDDGRRRAKHQARAGERERLRQGTRAEVEPGQRTKRAGIHGVAAERVARKLLAIDQEHADASSRQHDRRGGARGTCPGDEDVEHVSL